jgi:hypothetical protein
MMRILGVLALVILSLGVLQAQTTTAYMRVDNYLKVGGAHYANGAGDSLTALTVIPIAYTGSGELSVGQLPDSIRVVGMATSDTCSIDFNAKLYTSAGRTTYVVADSLTTNGSTKIRVVGVSKATWYGYDGIAIAAKQRAAGASVVAANNKVLLRVERYFTLRRRQ